MGRCGYTETYLKQLQSPTRQVITMTMTMDRFLISSLILHLLFVAATGLPTSTAVSYEGYRVVRITPTTDDQLKTLVAIINNAHVDVWREPTLPGRSVDVNVPPQAYATFTETLTSKKLTYSVVVESVQRQLDVENHEIRRRGQSREARDVVGSYVPSADIASWLNTLASARNSTVAIQNYGKSLESRNLTLVKISRPSRTPKPIVFIEAGIHAREWISPATAVWIINQLATSADPDVSMLLDSADWYVVPVANPDGYDYSHQTDRFWRKNRAPNKGSRCVGVDLNRNWDSHWMLVGASRRPCEETYAGLSAFSERETKGLRDVVLAAKTRIKAYFSLHSYSQAWLSSWGYTSVLPSDNDELLNVANKGADALRAVYDTYYDVGPGGAVLYPASGCSDDWAKEKAGIKYSYTLELRDTGSYGFLLPADQIIPTATETWAGIKAAAKLILTP